MTGNIKVKFTVESLCYNFFPYRHELERIFVKDFTGLYADINMVEIEDKIIEILVFIDNDINVAFVMFENILDNEIKEKLQEFVI
jgi:hypothetical protein